jgi:hypothetical protein
VAKKCWLKHNDGGIAVCGVHGYDYPPTCEYATCDACGAEGPLNDALLCKPCQVDSARVAAALSGGFFFG